MKLKLILFSMLVLSAVQVRAQKAYSYNLDVGIT